MRKLTIGMIVEGKICGIQPYGAFVAIDDHKTGLIHISEISHGYVKDISDFFNVNDKIKAKIIDIDEKNDQISLSLKALSNKSRKENIRHNRKPLVMKIGFKTIEEQLPIWIQEKTKEIKND